LLAKFCIQQAAKQGQSLQYPVEPVNVLLANVNLELCVALAKFCSPIPATQSMHSQIGRHNHQQTTFYLSL
jgi:hypothetical protein